VADVDLRSYSLDEAEQIVMRCIYDGYRMVDNGGQGDPGSGWAYMYKCPLCGHEAVKIKIVETVYTRNLVGCACAGCRAGR